MSYRKTAERTGLSAEAKIAALCPLLPGFAFTASAEEGAWRDKAGEQVASGLAATLDADAYYSEKLDPTRLQSTISPRPGAGRAELAFLRDQNCLLYPSGAAEERSSGDPGGHCIPN